MVNYIKIKIRLNIVTFRRKTTPQKH